MKATGIVRRIDDLGRIVIPREIRRSLQIGEGDPFEIFIDGKNIVLSKYCPTGMLDISSLKYFVEERLNESSWSSQDKKNFACCVKGIEEIVEANKDR